MSEVFTSSGLLYLLLVFIRILSIFILSPIFTRNMPNIAKIGFSIAFAFIVVNVIPLSTPLEIRGLIDLTVECIKQILIGALLSFIMFTFFSVSLLAGQVIDFQTGFSFSHAVDRTFGGQVALTGKFLNTIMLLMFFLTDSHHIMFRILYETFANIPPGAAVFSPDIVGVFIDIFKNSIDIAIRISMPCLAAILVTEILLGVVMKAVPQINFFVIGFPLKIMIGFFMMLIFIPVFCNMCDYIFVDMYDSIRKMFEGMVSH